jgi:DNA-binding GntR family transcriptional regulator
VNLRPFVLALSNLGLVQIEQNCGAFVRKIDLDEAVEIHDVYSALEELAARSAAAGFPARKLRNWSPW